MIKPHCPDFKPSPTASWICAWWDSEETENGTEWFCSRPDWEERVCESLGLRFILGPDRNDRDLWNKEETP